MLVSIFIGLLVLILAAWLAMLAPSLGRRGQHGGPAALLPIDIAAFHNLLRRDDDIFLRASLPAQQYRIAKRARTRATQRYLLWIAHNCAILQTLVRCAASNSHPAHKQPRSLSLQSFRLRIASLGLWITLWLQWAFPELDLMPGAVIGIYEDFAGHMRASFATVDFRRHSSALDQL
jgi:hypothetical protein